MRLKINPQYVINVLCIAAIVGLSAFVFNEKMNDHDDIIQTEWQIALKSSYAEIELFNSRILEEIVKNLKIYNNSHNLKHRNIVFLAQSKTDSLLILIDSLKVNPNHDLVCELQGKLCTYRSEMWQFMDYYPDYNETLPKFKPTDWLFNSWKKDSKSQFLSILEETKLKVILIEKDILCYTDKKTSVDDYFYEGYKPIISYDQIFPKVGDKLTADVFLSEKQFLRNTVYKLNGTVLPLNLSRKGVFQVKYDKPGVYPLLFRIEKTHMDADTVISGEKTYFITVH
jgi:hypothetical protein